MPSPISSNDSCVYDPNAQLSSTENLGASPGVNPVSPAPVTIPPVTIVGDAGAERLIEQHDAARGRECSLEALNATLSCGKAGLAAAGGVLMSSTLVGAAVGLGVTLAESVSCGKDVRAYSECKSE